MYQHTPVRFCPVLQGTDSENDETSDRGTDAICGDDSDGDDFAAAAADASSAANGEDADGTYLAANVENDNDADDEEEEYEADGEEGVDRDGEEEEAEVRDSEGEKDGEGDEDEDDEDDEEEGEEEVATPAGPDLPAARVSSRQRITTTVFINRVAVLKKNVYGLQEGEPSVLAREQAKERGGFGHQSEGVATL